MIVSAALAVRTIVSSLFGPTASRKCRSRLGSVDLAAYTFTIVRRVPSSRSANAVTPQLVALSTSSSAVDGLRPHNTMCFSTLLYSRRRLRVST